jgi:hypothetical protein
MVEPRPVVRVADIHAGPFANGIQTAQNLDVRRVVSHGLS